MDFNTWRENDAQWRRWRERARRLGLHVERHQLAPGRDTAGHTYQVFHGDAEVAHVLGIDGLAFIVEQAEVA